MFFVADILQNFRLGEFNADKQKAATETFSTKISSSRLALRACVPRFALG